ncbi:LIC_20245 family lipoprotein [Leptospira mayottensis]|uniref:Uncharacterized protein n=2 Tax=Leptospira mayottensis TaxID=1137606 RepID=A0AA87MN13_9LEPT|nr:hypothetical protein [Leptospira mayottensis]AXR62744.1 hypothetical protein DQM68_18945 [Leptospira mayottensis]AXR66362.1 hypothetical protein DQM28_19280 [Leptospira mayottensis]AZQ04129.1 hypothetical protein LEP1GSC190_19020 [Leptospira mayottensis 200901116]EKR99202.1 hypothetical protein LEP1GSC125_3648 [Leptospira mayottensis 200901122]TGN14230.1 hypothetical protein EHR03_04005 [Leptospira mayottensis]
MNRKIIYSIIIIFLIFSVYLFFFNEENPVVKDSPEDEKLKSGLSRSTVMRQEDSLFESGNFLDFSGSEESEKLAVSNGDITSIDDEVPTAGGYSSLSFEEKEKIRKEVIQKVKPLAERFPDNTLIPRELTEEQEEKRKKDEEKLDKIRGVLLEGGEVAKSEMEFYLDSKIKKSNDMTEILEYSMKFFKDSGKSYPDTSMKIIEDRLQSLRESKDELLNAKKNLESN